MWVSTRGPERLGIVTFDHLQPRSCRVTMEYCFAPDRVLPQVADHVGLFHGMLARCLQRFAMVAQHRRSQAFDGGEHREHTGREDSIRP